MPHSTHRPHTLLLLIKVIFIVKFSGNLYDFFFHQIFEFAWIDYTDIHMLSNDQKRLFGRRVSLLTQTKINFEADFLMLSFFVEKVENYVFRTANFTLDEVISIDSIIEEFTHQLLLVTT